MPSRSAIRSAVRCGTRATFEMSPRTERPRLWLCFTVCRYGVSRGAENALPRATHTPEVHLLAGQDDNPHGEDGTSTTARSSRSSGERWGPLRVESRCSARGC
ncbi:protein of unknown function [Methylorubrum extorquens]|uniref:Uncharacterized protein n=1 Tax=Methylorubrum extorquens TaxID=408 RepID=A0A2N9AWA7_METEX|nr:protein of unknown function [Methylorubrum extorquens]